MVSNVFGGWPTELIGGSAPASSLLAGRAVPRRRHVKSEYSENQLSILIVGLMEYVAITGFIWFPNRPLVIFVLWRGFLDLS